jgi:tetratricopeptide (TPR) repeat protein
LIETYPGVVGFQSGQAINDNFIALIQAGRGQTEESLATSLRAMEIRRRIATGNPGYLPFAIDLAVSQANVAHRLALAGRTAEALATLQEATTNLRRFVDSNSRFGQIQRTLAELYLEMGNSERTLGRTDRSIAALGDALEIHSSPRAQAGAAIPDYKDELAAIHTGYADTLMAIGNLKDAHARYAEAVRIRERLIAHADGKLAYGAGFAASLRRLALTKSRSGDIVGASSDLHRAARLLRDQPSLSAEGWFDLACCHASLSGIAAQEHARNSSAEVGLEVGQALSALQRAIALGYRSLPAIRSEPGLAPVLVRPEFDPLMRDLAFPVEPFARDR